MKRSLFCFAALFAAAVSMAAPLVTFTKTGSAGDWTLNLSVTNTLGIDDQKIYFFGVKLDDRDIAGSPSGWNPDSWIAWTNAPFGGSTEVYNNNWLSPTEADAIHNGDTLSGFLVHSTSTDAPTSVKWFAFSDGRTPYTGGDNFNATTNPGFEGVAGEAVPEPATALVLAGMIGLGALKRRRAR